MRSKTTFTYYSLESTYGLTSSSVYHKFYAFIDQLDLLIHSYIIIIASYEMIIEIVKIIDVVVDDVVEVEVYIDTNVIEIVINVNFLYHSLEIFNCWNILSEF